MLLKKTGFPEDDELVLCTVTKIFHHSVFVDVDEYGKSGMIHISEVSPGRIRNIRDFVKDGKKIVCKVLRVDKLKGHIDLSLRRVNEGQKKEKINRIKQEQKAEKIVEFTAKKLKMDFKKCYDEISPKIFERYGLLHLCFEDVVNGNISLDDIGIDTKIANSLTESIKERMKPQEVFVQGELELKSYLPDGVSVIQNALKNAIKIDKDNVNIIYKGGGKYKIKVKSNDYKSAEKILEKSVANVTNFMTEEGGKASFVKEG